MLIDQLPPDSHWARLSHTLPLETDGAGADEPLDVEVDDGAWLAYGGGQYAQTANLATREQQIAIATKVRDARGGYGDWPACAAKLGLPR